MAQRHIRTLIVTQWYPPESGPAGVPHVIAQALRERGHSVDVLTGFPNYPTGQLPPGWRMSWLQRQSMDGISIWRVPLYPGHDAGAARRALNYASFGLSAAAGYVSARATMGWQAAKGLPQPDVQWISYSPVTVGLTQLLGRLWDRTPTAVFVGDLWPDTLAVSGFFGDSLASDTIQRSVGAWCRLLYRHAEAIIVISPGVKKLLIERGVPAEKIHVIPVAANDEVFHPLSPQERARAREHFFPDAGPRRVLVYAGAMGAAQELETLIRASAQAGESGPRVAIAGSGTREAELKALAQRLGAPVRFLGRLPESEMSRLYGGADGAFIGLKDAPLSASTMPSKTQAIIATHTPIVCCAAGDVAELVHDKALGLSVHAGDPDRLAQALRTFACAPNDQLLQWRDSCAHAHRTLFSHEVVGDATDRVLRDIAQGGATLPAPADGITAAAGIRKRDVPALADLHTRAFPGFFLSQLGPQFLRRLYRGYADDPSTMAVVFRRGKRVIGVAIGTSDPAGFYSRLLKRDAVGFAGAAGLAVARNPRWIPRLLGGLFYRGQEVVDVPDAGLLASICLDPAEQGSGVGGRLMRAFLTLAYDRGLETIVLTTDAQGNDPVNALYQRTGGEIIDTYRTRQGRLMHKYRFDLATLPHLQGRGRQKDGSDLLE